MPPLADAARAALDAVAREIQELERLCVEIDAAVTARNWSRLDAAIRETRKATHAMKNAMADAKPYRDANFDKSAFLRLQQIFAYRQIRMHALKEHHESIGERLRALSRWKGYARSIGGKPQTQRSSIGLDSIR